MFCLLSGVSVQYSFAESAYLSTNRLDQIMTERASHLSTKHREVVAQAIVDASQNYQIDPILIIANIESESNWELKAVSSANCHGLMQLNPKTLKQEAKEAGVKGFNTKNVSHNITVGAFYLKKMISRFGGTRMGVMAYNAGPGNLVKYLKARRIPVSVRKHAHRVMNKYNILQLEYSNT